MEFYSLGMCYKSYDIIRMLLERIRREQYRDKDKLVVLDLTYGRGRFYRKIDRGMYYIIGVDIARHEWEVEPDEFYNYNAIVFVDELLNGKIVVRQPDIVVVDPPWNHEKRGSMHRGLGISNMPYHMRGVRSADIINAAIRLREKYGVPLVYRYKNPLDNSRVVVKNNIVVFRARGAVYYGII